MATLFREIKHLLTESLPLFWMLYREVSKWSLREELNPRPADYKSGIFKGFFG
jgi:hypothetical protein